VAADIRYVVRGATMRCSKGSVPTKINLPFSHGSYVNGKPVMIKTDRIVGTNISPFGLCIGQPCCPMILGDWIKFKKDTIIQGKGALITESVLICARGGQITFVTDGQNEG